MPSANLQHVERQWNSRANPPGAELALLRLAIHNQARELSMSTILFHSSSLVYELGLHNGRRLQRDDVENGASPDKTVIDSLTAALETPRVMLRRARDRQGRVDLQQSA